MKKIIVFFLCVLICNNYILEGMEISRESIDLSLEIMSKQEDMKNQKTIDDCDKKKKSAFRSFLLSFWCGFRDIELGSKMVPTFQGKVGTKL